MRWLALVLLLALPAGAQSSLSPDSIVHSTCTACHQPDASGRLTTLESLRTTPEGWRRIVRRMNRVYKLQLPDDLLEEAVRDLSAALALSPAEVAELERYRARTMVPAPWEPRLTPRLPAREPGLVPAGEAPLPEHFARTCLACHSYDVIAEQRREPEAWQRLRNMHLGYWPTLFLTHREMRWDEKAAECVAALARRFPFGTRPTPGAARLAGSYLVVGYGPDRGAYRMLRQVAADGTYSEPDGTGQARLYAGFLWRSTGVRQGQPLELTAMANGGGFSGRWSSGGQKGWESWTPLAGGPRLVQAHPTALVGPGRQRLELWLTGGADKLKREDLQLDLKVLSMKSPDPQTLVLEVEPRGLGARVVRLRGLAGQAQVVVAPRVDYLRVYPEDGVARVGGSAFWFEARGFSNGPDRQSWTDDDLDLGRVPARWRMDDYAGTTLDDDPRWVGQLDERGCFVPASAAPNPARLRQMNTGDVWVVALYQELRARVLLRVTVPDFRTDI